VLWLRVLWPVALGLVSLGTAIYVAIMQWRNKAANLRPARQLIDRARFVAGMPIGEAREASVVRVVGSVKAASPLVAPISCKPCVWWGVQVAVRRSMGAGIRRTNYWQGLLDLSEGAPFAVADGSAECLVDPALATMSTAQTHARVILRGRPMPSSIAVFLTANGLSLDELRDESFAIEEMILAPDTKVVVVGAGRLVQRGAVQGEADYRASQATWMSFDAQELELLVTDNRRLVAHAPAADPTPLDPRDIWEPRVQAAKDSASSISVDEYEGVLRAKQRLARITVIGALVLVVGSAIGIPKLLAWQRETAPTTLADSELESLHDLTQHQRVTMYRSDDAWIRAMGDRWNITTGSAPCPAGDVPVTTIADGGSLPPQSPRTDAMLRQLDALDARVFTAANGMYLPLFYEITRTQVSARDALIEGPHAWLYDHDQNRIICAGDVDPKAPLVGLHTAR
jgi:hypothetical protein